MPTAQSAALDQSTRSIVSIPGAPANAPTALQLSVGPLDTSRNRIAFGYQQGGQDTSTKQVKAQAVPAVAVAPSQPPQPQFTASGRELPPVPAVAATEEAVSLNLDESIQPISPLSPLSPSAQAMLEDTTNHPVTANQVLTILLATCMDMSLLSKKLKDGGKFLRKIEDIKVGFVCGMSHVSCLSLCLSICPCVRLSNVSFHRYTLAMLCVCALPPEPPELTNVSCPLSPPPSPLPTHPLPRPS